MLGGYPQVLAYNHSRGRIAQRESARFTRERSLVRSQVRPLTRPADLQRARSDAQHARLTAVKDSYDANNVFQLNHNIAPTRPDVDNRSEKTWPS
jgi:hypothetical protein